MRETVILPFLLLSLVSPHWPGAPADADEFREHRASRQARHYRSVADGFMESMSIRPGMTILDIGTGTGQFALGFAERLKGTGRVFATDIDDRCIREVKEEAERRGIGNIFPVLVDHYGVDEFYGRQKYDLITVMHVSIHDQVDYFARMRDNLAAGGRLAVVVYKKTLPFSERDFSGHFPGLLRELALEPPDSPFSKGLGEATRRLMREHSGAEPGEALRKAVIGDFNRMLSDPRFGTHFVDGPFLKKEVDFTPEERGFAEFLFRFLEEYDLFAKDPGKVKPRERMYARRFNKLLFLQRFRNTMNGDGLFAPALTTKIRADFEKAGFRLEKHDTDAMPFEDVLFFRPDGAAGQRDRPVPPPRKSVIAFSKTA